MAKSFLKLTRAAIRKLPKGQCVSEHGITFERLANSDGVFTVNIMVDRQRIHRTIGRESEGVTRTAAEAEAVLAEQSVDLVLSDVIPPGGMSGPQFAARIKTSHPRLRVLFMSGYPADEMDSADSPASGEILLNKPFKVFELAQALAQALK